MPKEILDELLEMEDEEVDQKTKELEDEEDVDKNATDEEEDEDTSPSVDDLMAKIEELEKAKSGLLKETKSERKRRQDFQQRLDQLTGAVGSIIQQREAAQKSAKPKEDDITVNGIPIHYTEDGDAYVDPKDIKGITKQFEEKLEKVSQETDATNAELEYARKEQEVINSVISEDDAYEGAYKEFSKARKWVEDYVVEWLDENGYGDIPVTSAQALTHIFDDSVEKEFNKDFKDVNLEDVVLAKDSPRLLRRALKMFVSDDQDVDDDPTPNKSQDDKFKKVLKKPSSLGKDANADGGPDLMDKLGELSTEDYLNMTDAEIEKLNKMVLDEEKRDGIKFRR